MFFTNRSSKCCLEDLYEEMNDTGIEIDCGSDSAVWQTSFSFPWCISLQLLWHLRQYSLLQRNLLQHKAMMLKRIKCVEEKSFSMQRNGLH